MDTPGKASPISDSVRQHEVDGKPRSAGLQQSGWLWVMCLVGVDYFSSLAYQPSITYEVADVLGPIATIGVVLVTLFGLLPIYSYVAGQSPRGEGAIGLLERHFRGWRGKSLVLLMLGFAATDFVMTKTLSLADAAEHTIHNDNARWKDTLQFLEEETKEIVGQFLDEDVVKYFNKQMMVTIVLGVVGFIFWFIIRRGFNKRVIGLAAVIVGLYLVLTALVIGSGLYYLANHWELVEQWYGQIGPSGARPAGRHDWLAIVGFCLLAFPELSLGLSGFEMSMVVMPQVKGEAGDDPARPAGRIRHTRKLLLTAALIMSVFLLASVFVTTLLIPRSGFMPEGHVSHRALAYLAHGGIMSTQQGASALNPLFGNLFGTLYDLSTVLILTLAGTSIITSLQNLLPAFLLRFGMEQKWATTWGVLFGIFALINLAVTVWFKASVSEQRGAYATGVLASVVSAAILTAVDRRARNKAYRQPDKEVDAKGEPKVKEPPSNSVFGTWYFAFFALLFLVPLVVVIVKHPVGLGISVCFIVAIFLWSVISRAVRSSELRTIGFEFVDAQSRFLWDSLVAADFPALVPHRPGKHQRDLKELQIRQEHQLAPTVDIVFLEVALQDPSDFYQKLLIEVFREDARFVIRITRGVSTAHAIAAVALEMSKVSKPPVIHFGWSECSLLEASWSFWAFGEGNIPWKVRELIISEQPDPARRPRVVIG
jgi:hypothetical protein